MSRWSTLLFVAVFGTLVVGAFASSQCAVPPPTPKPLPAPALTTYTGTVSNVSTDAAGNLSFELDVPGKGMPSPLTITVTPDTVYWVGGQLADPTAVVNGARAVVKLTACPSGGTGIAAVVEIVPNATQNQ